MEVSNGRSARCSPGAPTLSCMNLKDESKKGFEPLARSLGSSPLVFVSLPGSGIHAVVPLASLPVDALAGSGSLFVLLPQVP